MMKTAVLSDAHGNLPALKAVLDNAFSTGVSDFWYLGDAVGYMPYPYQVWDELQCLNIQPEAWLAGNHEWGLLGKLERKELQLEGEVYSLAMYSYIAWPILLLQQKALADQHTMLEHLASLPVMSSPRRGIYLGHGSFSKDVVTSLIREEKQPAFGQETLDQLTERAWENVRYVPESGGTPRLLCLGHTHLAGIWTGHQKEFDYRWQKHDHPVWQADSPAMITPILLNPGSVGLSRDGRGCALYAIISWQDGDCTIPQHIEIRRVPYDQTELQKKMAEIDEYKKLLTSGFWFPCREL